MIYMHPVKAYWYLKRLGYFTNIIVDDTWTKVIFLSWMVMEAVIHNTGSIYLTPYQLPPLSMVVPVVMKEPIVDTPQVYTK